MFLEYCPDKNNHANTGIQLEIIYQTITVKNPVKDLRKGLSKHGVISNLKKVI